MSGHMYTRSLTGSHPETMHCQATPLDEFGTRLLGESLVSAPTLRFFVATPFGMTVTRLIPAWTPARMWRGLVSIIALGFITISLTACGGETLFPKQPEAHRLFDEVHEWPNEYYWLVASGVSSRVMGLGSVDSLLSELEEQWTNIEPLDTAEKLINYCRTHDLAPIAEAIEKTLSQNSDMEPTGESHRQLQADAIKRGLVNAFWEVKGQPPR